MSKNEFLYTNGLVIGRFLPFHIGHCFLIDTARSMCKNLYVCMCSKKDDRISGIVRCMWIKEHYSVTIAPFGKVIVKHITKEIQTAHISNIRAPKIWAKEILLILNKKIDAVFASEPYGALFAKHLNASLIPVDVHRDIIPISGSLIRSRPLAYWKYLPPVVQRAMMCIVGIGGNKMLIHKFIKRTKASVYIPYIKRCKNNSLTQPVIEKASLAELRSLCLYSNSPVICVLLPHGNYQHIPEYKKCQSVLMLDSETSLRRAYKKIREMLLCVI